MRSLRRLQFSQRAYPNTQSGQIKRVAEVLIASALVAITLPLISFLALAIQWEGPGPILERHSRIGRDGRRFEMLKFRTTEADDPEHARPAWARKTTQMGELLRYTRMESLPQLFNVLRGEMSLRELPTD